MKWKKGLAAMLVATALLAACGADEEPVEEKVVEQESVELDVTNENNEFRDFALAQMPDFVADTELLASYVQDGKLEEAQKLFPLVIMYYERLQPLTGSFKELDEAIYAPFKKGATTTGFYKLAHGLFDEKTTTGYSDVAQKLVGDVRQLEQDLPNMDLASYKLLNQVSSMLDETLNTTLKAKTAIDAELYIVKAQTEAVDKIVQIYMTRADSGAAAKVIEATTALNGVLSFYELGKEDYIKYSLFTNKQRTELTDGLTAVHDTFKTMAATVK